MSFACEVRRSVLPGTAMVAGVDLGLNSFATIANGPDWHIPIPNPRFFRRDEADLKRVQKLKDAAKNTQKWDENRRRKKALAHIHERVRFRREDFAHKRSRELVNIYQVIAFEELEPQQIGRSRGMRKSIADAAW